MGVGVFGYCIELGNIGESVTGTRPRVFTLQGTSCKLLHFSGDTLWQRDQPYVEEQVGSMLVYGHGCDYDYYFRWG